MARTRNHVKKFLRALPTKWRLKVIAIKESKDLSTLSLDELIGNLKVYEVVVEKDLEIFKSKKEKYKSLALIAIKFLSEEEATSSHSDDEKYVMAVRDFKKFFRRRGKFIRQPYDDKKNFQKVKEDKKQKDDRRCFNDSGDDCKKEEICLMALDDNEVLSDTPYYSSSSLDNESWENNKAYIILNKETMKVEESLNVKFDESPPPKSPPLEDDDMLECDIIENQEKGLEIKENEPFNKDIIHIKESKDHPLDIVIEPKNVKEAIQDESWTLAMQDELNQFKSNVVWSLVPPPNNQTIIARLESIRILLAYACAYDFKLYQMDVKSAFLNAFINEEVYVAQPPGFIDFEKPNHVFKLKKALYGLKQAPKAWYDRLKSFLIRS
ncbi:retrovirus-related pol polyprotein from transposon TNT 1-94 [Tanacetum coccineum]|uniref:Retrovirus-related pol polyprotein from transposon TNT 1-94 n=1 Tax=Tanacetum coccineum TaxID=301880 RepID=A0ABQ5DDF0_9ASTR